MSRTDWRAVVRDALPEITGDAARDADMIEELAQFLAQREEDLVGRGVSPALAAARARAELLDAPGIREALRDSARDPARPLHPLPPPTNGRANMFTDLLQDLRYGARVLARNKAFATAAILTLSLGIGASAAIFSVVDGVLLRPVPFADQGRLAMIWETDRNTGTTREPASLPDYLDFIQRSTQVAQFGAFVGTESNLTPADGEPSRVAALGVTEGFLPMLGIRPTLGRGFTALEDRPGGPQSAIISDRLWERQFQRDRNVLGKTLRLNDLVWTIVGVLGRDADFGTMQILRQAAYGRAFADRDLRSRVDVWLPLRADPQQLPRSTHPILVVGRLAPSATVATANQELVSIMADLERLYPSDNVARGAHVEAMDDVIFGRVRTSLWVLLASVGFVLLIACVNVANLLLARGTVRMREVAVRTAIGALPRRLVRQFAAENLVITFLSAVLGVALAYGGLKLLLAIAPADIPRLAGVAVNGRVLLVSLGLATVTGLAFGLVPVMQARRLDVQSALKSEESRGSTASRGRGALRSALVVSEVALAVMLVVGAGLLIRSFWRLSSVNPGFDVSGVVKAEFQLPTSRYPTGFRTWPNFVEVHRFNEELLRRARAIPGVEAAAVVGNHPLDAGFTNSWRVVGRESEAHNWPEISIRRVSPDYFATVTLRLVKGRLLGDADGTLSAPAGLINETTAKRFFDGREPLGAQVSFWGVARTIVGVVADEKSHGLTQEAPPAVYIPMAQAPSFDGSEALIVRATGDPSAVMAQVRSAVLGADRQLAVFGVEPLSRTLAESVGQQRFVMLLLLVFAGVALALAAIGIHGVLSYAVAQRRHEIGVRLALGAPPGRVTALVMRQGATLTAVGLAVGLAGALALTRVLGTLLYGVSARDAVSLLAALPVLGVVALVATWLPARRAVRIDPVAAMREE